MLPEPISDAELDAILNRNRVNGGVSMLRPMDMYFPRDLLMDLTRRSLEAMQMARRPADETAKQRKAADRAVQQRIDFMSWLSGQGETIYLSVYPADADGLTDEDVQDVLDDEDLWPFNDT